VPINAVSASLQDEMCARRARWPLHSLLLLCTREKLDVKKNIPSVCGGQTREALARGATSTKPEHDVETLVGEEGTLWAGPSGFL